MIKKTIHKILKTIFFFYVTAVPGRIKFRSLENLNFRKVDFTNYKKLKMVIFKNNFIQNDKELSIFNFDFLNYCLRIGGKKGIEIGKINIINWQNSNWLKINKLWESEIIAKRIINLIYNFEYFNSLSSSKK